MKKLVVLSALAGIVFLTGCTTPSVPASSTTTSDAETSSLPAPGPPSIATCESAATLMDVADQQVKDDFVHGSTLTDGPRVQWWSDSHAGDVVPAYYAKVMIKTYGDVMNLFSLTNTNPPDSLANWGPGSNLSRDVSDWYQSNVGHGYDPTLQEKVNADIAQLAALVHSVGSCK